MAGLQDKLFTNQHFYRSGDNRVKKSFYALQKNGTRNVMSEIVRS